MKNILEKEVLFKLKEKPSLRYMVCSNQYFTYPLLHKNSTFTATCYKKRVKRSIGEWEIKSIKNDQLYISPLEQQKIIFDNKKKELIADYEGKYIALINGKVEDSDTNFSDLANRVYTKYGYREIFMTLVTKENKPHRLSPKFV